MTPQRRGRSGLAAIALVGVLWATAAVAHIGDSCELNSECDSGEQCRMQQCMNRKTMPPLMQDEPDHTNVRQPSGSSVCMTPVVICPMPGSGLSGTICYCSTASGPVGGIIP